MKVLDKLQRYNYPAHIVGIDVINSDYKCILATSDIPLSICTHDDEYVYLNGDVIAHYFNGIVIDDSYWGSGFNSEYFSTSIKGKYVYAPMVGCGRYLNTDRIKYAVSSKPLTKIEVFEPSTATGNKRLYKQVKFTEEKTLGDLYKNACAYAYYRGSDCFERLPEAGIERDTLEVVRESAILREVGTIYTRLVNLNTIVQFLLTKVNLTSEEYMMVSDLSDIPVDMAELATASYDQAADLSISRMTAEELDSLTNYSGAIWAENVYKNSTENSEEKTEENSSEITN